MPKLYYDSVEVGDPVAPLTKPPVTRVQIAKFAGASLDFSPLHIDDDFAKAAGYGGVFAHGAISLGFAIEAITRWLENGRVFSATAMFQKLVWPGDILTAKGVVVDKYESGADALVDGLGRSGQAWPQDGSGRRNDRLGVDPHDDREYSAKAEWLDRIAVPSCRHSLDFRSESFVPSYSRRLFLSQPQRMHGSKGCHDIEYFQVINQSISSIQT